MTKGGEMEQKYERGWHWVLVKAFSSGTYTWRSEWIMVEYDGWWRWDWEGLSRKGLRDMTKIVRVVGPIEKPEVME